MDPSPTNRVFMCVYRTGEAGQICPLRLPPRPAHVMLKHVHKRAKQIVSNLSIDMHV